MDVPDHIIECNGADVSVVHGDADIKRKIRLDLRNIPGLAPNIKVALPQFVGQVYHLPDRVLDLMEIAAYVYCADRRIYRGSKDSLEYHSWPRSLHFVIRVRDANFWQQQPVKRGLEALLEFLSGNRAVTFEFQAGHTTPPTNLFDEEGFQVAEGEGNEVVLFSGGIDSLSGIAERLATTNDNLCLVSHRSGLPSTNTTQDGLLKAINEIYPGRAQHFRFRCGLTQYRAEEETQRTRFFLYTSIAYALAQSIGKSRLFVYENGITSLNFPKRQDLMNARASRTTHPKTIHLLQSFLSAVHDGEFKVETPFFWKTKSDVLETLKSAGRLDLLSRSVSCSKTFNIDQNATHCGGCSQCVDRRFASFASQTDEYDDVGIYDADIVKRSVVEAESRTTIVDYMHQAWEFKEWSLDQFYVRQTNPLTEVVDYLGGEQETVVRIHDLCHRRGEQVFAAMGRMRNVCDDLAIKPPPHTVLRFIDEREYLKQPVNRLVESICKRLTTALPIAFQVNAPKNENDLNDKISAILNADSDELKREHPALLFALARTVPDHSYPNHNLLIETKYIRNGTTPSKVTDGLAADVTKYGKADYTLFVVYDPVGAIHDQAAFRKDFEADGRCTVCIIR